MWIWASCRNKDSRRARLGSQRLKVKDLQPHSFSDIQVKCFPPDLGAFGLRKAQPRWVLFHSKFPVLGKWFWATNLLLWWPSREDVANFQTSGMFLYFLSSFFPVSEQLTAPVFLSQFVQEQNGCSSSSGPRPTPTPEGRGWRWFKSSTKATSSTEYFPPPRPSGQSSSCLHQHRMWLREDLFGR